MPNTGKVWSGLLLQNQPDEWEIRNGFPQKLNPEIFFQPGQSQTKLFSRLCNRSKTPVRLELLTF
ncbi:MAG: hypothetical protein N4J56_007761 [Chroococcidiopsis sp. SAG 2025]|uniref:hypothetical protein n=1 Tax=Chroococcidiopsis sp. SAG 2025 TaxID=171389 RepID=UPI002936FDCA|nr:hypothetical protein [Chroococcidiopsis sp. SAG 2025]MDV2998056.1 hypothetical protein [Chroococcidiopsis sp. SAG 2025]